ncbi:MAG: NAD(P)/FAD-dependent oxidoreductase [Myxococcota bacterium]
MNVDLVVIGGGLAGATLSTLVARTGCRVVVVEKDAFPRDKLCGEFLSPEASLTLRRLGLEEQLMSAAPPRLERGWFTEARGQSAEVPLPAAGLGLSRWTLDGALQGAALEAGVDWIQGEAGDVVATEEGLRVQVSTAHGSQTVEARIGVGAYGRHGRLDRALGRTRSPRRFVGLKRHHLGPADDNVEIHAFPGGYCGVNAVDGGRVNVCALVERSWLMGLSDRSWTGVSQGFRTASPWLLERLSALRPDPKREMLTVAGIDFDRREPLLGPLLMVGDGAAMIAPLAGDGQAMALRGAEALAELILADDSAETLSQAWQARFRRVFDRRLGLGRHLQEALLNPRIAPWLLRSSRWFPALPAWLAKQTREAIRS